MRLFLPVCCLLSLLALTTAGKRKDEIQKVVTDGQTPAVSLTGLKLFKRRHVVSHIERWLDMVYRKMIFA